MTLRARSPSRRLLLRAKVRMITKASSTLPFVLRRLGFGNVETKIADGYYGWPEKGPFDAIVVTAAASHIPPPLLEQLKPEHQQIVEIHHVV